MEENWLRFNKETKIAFIDVETFNLGLTFQTNRPWQIATLKVMGDNVITNALGMPEEKDVMVKWADCQFKIGAGAAKITRFNQALYDRLAVEPDDAFYRIWEPLLWADRIIMHNGLRFDIYLLKGYAEYMGEDWSFILPKVIDTKAVAQGIKLNRPFQPHSDDWMEYQYKMSADHTRGIKTNLTSLGKEMGIDHDYDNLHNALVDLHLNLKVWNKLKFQLEL